MKASRSGCGRIRGKRGMSKATSKVRSWPWAWFSLGILLAASVTYTPSAESSLDFKLSLFLPLLTAWVAVKHGARVFPPLLLLGVLGACEISHRVFENMVLSAGFA